MPADLYPLYVDGDDIISVIEIEAGVTYYRFRIFFGDKCVYIAGSSMYTTCSYTISIEQLAEYLIDSRSEYHKHINRLTEV